MKTTKMRINLEGLEEIKKAVGDTYRTRVGILGGDAAQKHGDLDNATLGVIQMFGSISRNIPPRDFLRMPIELKKRELVRALGSGALRAAFMRGDYRTMFGLLGLKAEEIVDEAFQTSGFGQWPPNSPATVAQKGSSKPLIDTGQLRRSITSDVVSKGSVT